MSDDIHNECTCNPLFHFHADLLVDYVCSPVKYRDDLYSKHNVKYRCRNCGLSRNPPKAHEWPDDFRSKYCICTSPSAYRCNRSTITCCYDCGCPILYYHLHNKGYCPWPIL